MKKLLALALILLVSPLPSFAAFGVATNWDVQTTGVNTNGGAFDSGVGSPGTNEAMGAGTAITITLTGTTTGTGSPVFSSTTHGPGNFAHIASGAGCTTGWYEVLSQSAGTATFDHAMGSNGNVCVGTIGGSLLTIAQANSLFVSGNTINIQTGTYIHTANVSLATGTVSLTGYASTWGDGGAAPTITTATNSTPLFYLNSASNSYTFTNLLMTNTASVRANAIESRTGSVLLNVYNVGFDGFTDAVDCDNVGATFPCGFVGRQIEAKNCTTKCIGIDGTRASLDASWIHDQTNAGSEAVHLTSSTATITRSIFSNNAGGGASSLGAVTATNNTFALNGGVGFAFSSTSGNDITNNIAYGNTTYGINCSNAWPVFNNATGANGTSAYSTCTSVNGVLLTANPFVNSGANNYALNSTAGGGAAAKAAGYPGVFPGGLTTGYLDIGAVQSQGSGSGSSGPYGYVR